MIARHFTFRSMVYRETGEVIKSFIPKMNVLVHDGKKSKGRIKII